MTFIVIFAFLMQPCQGDGKHVAKDFSYPPAMLTETAESLVAKTLSGTVVYGEGQKLSEALVEIINADRQRVEAVLTNADGKFCFTGIADGQYLLRISKPKFDTLIVPFTVSRKARTKSVSLQLHLSA